MQKLLVTVGERCGGGNVECGWFMVCLLLPINALGIVKLNQIACNI